MRKNPYRLICACCGESALGRQWWNRDTGYGLCARCVDFVRRSSDEADLETGYGKRGIHFATELTPNCVPGMLVAWKTIEDEWHTGVLKEWDNNTAIVMVAGKDIAVRAA